MPPDVLAAPNTKLTIKDILPGFLDYMVVERRFAPATIETYRRNVDHILREIGDAPVSDINLHFVISLKARLVARGVGDARVGSVIGALKALLRYARDVENVPVLDLTGFSPPRRQGTDIRYVTDEELQRFRNAIQFETWRGGPRLAGYRFRAFFEALLATAMRISEALSLNRDSINFESRRARIVGKGGKQRTVYFSSEALDWSAKYLGMRTDDGDALFVDLTGSRLKPSSIYKMLERVSAWAGLRRALTANAIRNTTAVNLLRNGCHLNHVREVLGHKTIESTARICLGLFNEENTRAGLDAYLASREKPFQRL